jgi:hypothetical protein
MLTFIRIVDCVAAAAAIAAEGLSAADDSLALMEAVA